MLLNIRCPKDRTLKKERKKIAIFWRQSIRGFKYFSMRLVHW
jgi:hypothetical protein